ncbi:hypothetical protein A4A49_60816 [Nicotiana attenuata]|uniref:Uncharacterized protein n=1 Tax=Nicotiana attenuata TaxID=49451 RepID=A0A1J6I274_NICAT|nr:hypothetical protein A4A49_60816 [Nicotiana attenuata]
MLVQKLQFQQLKHWRNRVEFAAEQCTNGTQNCAGPCCQTLLQTDAIPAVKHCSNLGSKSWSKTAAFAFCSAAISRQKLVCKTARKLVQKCRPNSSSTRQTKCRSL